MRLSIAPLTYLQPHGHEPVEVAAEVEDVAAGGVAHVKGRKLSQTLRQQLHLTREDVVTGGHRLGAVAAGKGEGAGGYAGW